MCPYGKKTAMLTRCEKCGWDSGSGVSHEVYRARKGECAALDRLYDYRLGDTPDDFVCPYGGHVIGAQPALWRRVKGEREWSFVSLSLIHI